MDDVDARVGQHRLEALVGRRQVQRGSAFRSPGMAGTDHAVHLHAQPAQGLHVHHADEAGPNDGGTDFADVGEPALDLWAHFHQPGLPRSGP